MQRKKIVRTTVDIDLESGEFEITYNNISSPGEPMDYNLISKALKKVFKEADTLVSQDAESEETGQARKDLH